MMLPRHSADNADNEFAAQYGRGNGSSQQYHPNAVQYPDDMRRFAMQQQQQQQHIGQHPLTPRQGAMAPLDHHQMSMMPTSQGFRHHPHDMGSPHTGMGSMAYGMTEISPSLAHRMQMNHNIYNPINSAGSNHSPNYGLMAESTVPPSSNASQGGGTSISQAEREEELLLNLLIARRQRGRMSGGKAGGRDPQSLFDELMRLRQSRGQGFATHSTGGMASIPPVPGMPPLFAGESNTMPQQAPTLQGPHIGGLSSYHPQMDYRKTDPTAMNIATEMERIDRSPTRYFDARSQEMRDFSMRSSGLKRGPFDPMGPYKLPMEGYPLSPPKKKRTHKKKPADMPRRPLSAYNLFFSEERERILAEIKAKEEGTVGDTGSGKEEDEETQHKPKALLRPLIPSQKQRRPHRKTHGKISFKELARMVGERWKALPEERRKYYQDLANEDMKRQKAAMEEYYAKQNAVKSDSKVEGKDDKDDKDLRREDDDSIKDDEIGRDGEEDSRTSESSNGDTSVEAAV